MNKFFREDIKKIPVNYQADVAVAGGGIAGIAAALAAARMGASVLLIEKQCIVGGLATTGLIARYLPLCDGYLMGLQRSCSIYPYAMARNRSCRNPGLRRAGLRNVKSDVTRFSLIPSILPCWQSSS